MSHDSPAFVPEGLRAPSVPKLELRGLSKTFSTARGDEHIALAEIDLAVADEEFVCLVGRSGSGKTTLLSTMAGLTKPSSGEILVDGKTVQGPGPDRGVVFQQDSIFPWRTVIKNVEYGLEVRGVPKDERRRIATEHMRMVGLESFADFYPKELSGGMKKRAVIATVFANNPAVLLMDEPFGSLDYGTKAQLQREVLGLWTRERKTTIFVTHDVEEAAFLADRVIVLEAGEKVAEVTIPLARPRVEEMRLSTELAELRHQLADLVGSDTEPGA